ncbi:MAG: hypothetical protein LUI39_06615 [Lachnospiraceae bacterium]|nr:hypothetical protein [Lachnospiraceae bacterium]
MSSIKVNTAKMQSGQSSLLKYQIKVSQIESEVGNIRTSLNFSLKNRSRIVSSLSSVETALERSRKGFMSLESALADTIAEYQETEEKVKDCSGRLTKSGITEAVVTVASDNSDESTEKLSDYLLPLIKAILKDLEKFGGITGAGFAGSLVSYLQDLKEFLTGDMQGLSGSADLCDLAETSSKLWNALYKLLKSSDSTGVVENAWGTAAAEVGLGGSLIAVIGGIVDMVESVTSDDTTTGEKISSVIDAISESVGVEKSIYELQNVGTKSSGIYSETGVWATFATTIFSSISQLVKSVDNYSSDGSWDWGDTGATGVEVAISGLSTIISGLTFGIISPETFGTSTEEISEGIENWANDVGTSLGNFLNDLGAKAGKYIGSDLEKYNQYKNGNIFTKMDLSIEALLS